MTNQATEQKTNPIEVLAVTKAIKEKAEKEARAVIGAGEYGVDTWVHIKGMIKVGDDYEQAIWQTAKPLALLALVADKLNEATLRNVFADYVALLDDPTKMADFEAKGKDLKERTDDAIKALKAETRQICKGKVTTKLDVEFADGMKV